MENSKGGMGLYLAATLLVTFLRPDVGAVDIDPLEVDSTKKMCIMMDIGE